MSNFNASDLVFLILLGILFIYAIIDLIADSIAERICNEEIRKKKLVKKSKKSEEYYMSEQLLNYILRDNPKVCKKIINKNAKIKKEMEEEI